MNLLLPRSDRRRFFLLSDFQSNTLHGDINKTLKTLLSPFFLTSTAAKPLNNAAVPLRTFLSGNEYPSKRCRRPTLIPLKRQKNSKRRRRPPLIPLRKHKPLKSLPQASSYPSPETKIHSKRCRRVPFIPLQRQIPLKTSPHGAEGAAIRQRDIYFDFILNCFNLGADG